MLEVTKISGSLRIGAHVAPDGRPAILLEWPDRSGLLLPRDQALSFVFNILHRLIGLYDSAEEWDNACARAKAEVAFSRPISGMPQ